MRRRPEGIRIARPNRWVWEPLFMALPLSVSFAFVFVAALVYLAVLSGDVVLMAVLFVAAACVVATALGMRAARRAHPRG